MPQNYCDPAAPPLLYRGVNLNAEKWKGWSVEYAKSVIDKESAERKRNRAAWLKTANLRRLEYQRIDSQTAVELIATVGELGGGDDYDGGFTDAGMAVFLYAKRRLRLRVRALENAASRVGALQDALASIAEQEIQT